MVSMSGWILSMKVLLISAGVVCLTMGLKFSVPIAVNGIPAMWSIIMSWLKPPYLYIIINGIIITIAASSRFHQSKSEPEAGVRSEHLISVRTPPSSSFSYLSSQADINTVVEESRGTAEVVVPEIDDRVVELTPVVVNGAVVNIETEEEIVAGTEAGDEFDESTFAYNNTLPPPPPQERNSPELHFESLFPAREKPLVSSRFTHRKPNRTTPEVTGGARSLGVAKPKKQETLESTWKMITEGRHVPLTRHQKKSDAVERHETPGVDEMAKPETLKVDRSYYEASIAKIRKDPSLGQDELNRRVEAFIKKFNEDMRMQRQESLNQYMEMINRGV